MLLFIGNSDSIKDTAGSKAALHIQANISFHPHMSNSPGPKLSDPTICLKWTETLTRRLVYIITVIIIYRVLRQWKVVSLSKATFVKRSIRAQNGGVSMILRAPE